MKMSKAILKGMERFPKKAIGSFQVGDDSACVMGCANWTMTGDARIIFPGFRSARIKFYEAFEMCPETLNDAHHFPRDVIAGMFAAIGE